MSSLKGNRAAQLKRRLQDKAKPKAPKDRPEPETRIKKISLSNLDDWFLDDEG